MSFFSDKKETQRSATALGYVAHVCSLLSWLSAINVGLTFLPSGLQVVLNVIVLALVLVRLQNTMI